MAKPLYGNVISFVYTLLEVFFFELWFILNRNRQGTFGKPIKNIVDYDVLGPAKLVAPYLLRVGRLFLEELFTW